MAFLVNDSHCHDNKISYLLVLPQLELVINENNAKELTEETTNVDCITTEVRPTSNLSMKIFNGTESISCTFIKPSGQCRVAVTFLNIYNE